MQSLYPKKILVVDDEEDALVPLSNILRRAQYAVITTTKGEEAIALSKQKLPDLIILDILLPDIDGGSVAEILSQEPSTAGIPIIFLTGILSKEEELLSKQEGGRKSGKHYMLAKPVTKEDLLQVIQKILPA